MLLALSMQTVAIRVTVTPGFASFSKSTDKVTQQSPPDMRVHTAVGRSALITSELELNPFIAPNAKFKPCSHSPEHSSHGTHTVVSPHGYETYVGAPGAGVPVGASPVQLQSGKSSGHSETATQ
tara:strand:+ start:148 stop:519 length:372 start_codon:yes stop_codon:yes gene_type:complete